MNFLKKHPGIALRATSIFWGIFIVLMGMRAIEKGRFGYYNYMQQPITGEFAVLCGVILVVWPFIPKRFYYWLFGKMFDRTLSKIQNNGKKKKKLSKKAIEEREASARRHTESLTDWEKW